MKINGMNGEIQIGMHRNSPSVMESDVDFKGIFDQQMTTVTESRQSQTTSCVDARARVLEQGDKLLSLLDTYAADLENPGKMLKQIEPLVNSIEDEVSQIQGTVSDPSWEDNDLRLLMEELTITADVAMYKFHRGDFL